MDFKECARLADENRVCYLATAEGSQPRVRAIAMWYADETGFYFQSQSVKAMVKQIEKNHHVEACFQIKDRGMLRVTGKAKIITDKKVRAKCIAERKNVRDMGITDPGDPLLTVFQIYTGEAFIWTMKDSMKEASLPRVKF
jgi:pyridoxamine 5'-phosphate oxidase